jgi:Replicase family/Primase C terminal 1 (PriCT-1)
LDTETVVLNRPKRQGPSSAADERFIANLPPMPFCSDDFHCGIWRCERSRAIERAYIEPNYSKRMAYVALDIDHPAAAFATERVGFPPATYTIVNPRTAHAHLLFELHKPIFPSHSEKADRLLSDVWGGLARALRADIAYNRLLVQNPLNDRWYRIVSGERYGLGELADLVREIPRELMQQTPRSTPLLPLHRGTRSCFRNCQLFETVRRIAYIEARQAQDRDAWRQRVLELCLSHNRTYATPLPEREVMDTARSIADWTWQKRNTIGRGPHRGVLQLGPLGNSRGKTRRQEIKDRQKKGADYARLQRTGKVEKKIADAVAQFKVDGAPIKAATIAKRAGVNRRSVDRYLQDRVRNRLRVLSCQAPGAYFPDVHQNTRFSGLQNGPPVGPVPVCHG